MDGLKERLADVYRRVAQAAERSGRELSEIQVVAVSKTVPPELVLEAYRLGQKHFGENRVQELQEKRRLLSSMDPMKDAVWHLVGHLQSNKANLAAELSDIIHSVDSVKLARRLDSRAERLHKQLPVLLQVDYSSEPQRFGFSPDELEDAVRGVIEFPNLSVQGLMTIAPLGLEGDRLRQVFRQLKELRDRLADRYPEVGWRHLSMGMTGDFEVAIEEGATIVRIGRAIFGERLRRE
jgi:pyridoxal phosphate enzyme (YggS family)